MEKYNMDTANYVFIIAAIFMAYCLYLVLTLKSQLSGGLVGKYWKFLTILVVIFTLGYFALPFFGDIPEEILRLTVAGVFLFGAFYVLITIKLIKSIIQALSE